MKVVSKRAKSLLFVFAAAALGLPLEMFGQHRPRPETAPSAPSAPASVTVLMRQKLSNTEAHVEIRRRPRGEDRNLIAVTPAATSEELAVALDALARMRARIGDNYTSEIATVVRPGAVHGATSRSDLESARAMIRKLRSSPVQTVSGYGKGPTMKVQLAAQSRKRG